jgi:glutaredoxin 3
MQENNTPLVEIFSTPNCHFCHMAKDWFNEVGIKYVDYDVASDIEKRKEMVEMSGGLSVPVIKIENDIIIGFNQDKIKELLKMA